MKKHTFAARIKHIAPIVALAIIGLQSTTVSAQRGLSSNEKKQYEDALTYASRTNNRQAIRILRSLHEAHPDNIDISYNLGLCYINMSGNPDSALYFLKKVQDADKKNRWDESKGDLLLALGRVEQLLGNPDGALKYYDEIERRDKDGIFTDLIVREREICANATMLTENPVKLELQPVGDEVNSEWNDYRPVLSIGEDTMYFTSRRPKKDADKRILFDDGQYEEGVYRAIRKGNKWDGSNWGSVEQIHKLVVDNKKGQGQETVTSITGDGQELYICHDGDIYVSHLDKNGKWQPAEKLPAPVNTLFDEQNAYVTPDGQELYLSSDAPGGYGGRDIYRSRRLPNGLWGEPLNLGPGVNTEYDEDAPIFHVQTQVLYFCSNGHNTMGGYDIFYSPEGEGGIFEAAKNIGYPINSADDDLYFMPSVDKDRAFYASIRYQEGKPASYDIYEVEYEQPEQNRMSLVAAPVEAAELNKVTIWTFNEKGERVGLGHPHSKTGRFLEIVEAGQAYDIIAVYAGDTIRINFSTKKSDSYHARHAPIELGPIVFVPKTEELTANSATSVADGDKNKTQGSSAQGNSQTDGPWLSWITTDELPYTVQIMSLRKALQPEQLKGLEQDKVAEYQYRDGWFVYSYGAYATYREALEAQESIRQKSPYKDAFTRKGEQYKRFIK